MEPPNSNDSMIPKVAEARQPIRSCKLCVQGLAQRQDAARPHAVSLRLPIGVLGAREGPAPRAQVASELALPCPSPGASDPLGGADAPLCPSSLQKLRKQHLVGIDKSIVSAKELRM